MLEYLFQFANVLGCCFYALFFLLYIPFYLFQRFLYLLIHLLLIFYLFCQLLNRPTSSSFFGLIVSCLGLYLLNIEECHLSSEFFATRFRQFYEFNFIPKLLRADQVTKMILMIVSIPCC